MNLREWFCRIVFQGYYSICGGDAFAGNDLSIRSNFATECIAPT